MKYEEELSSLIKVKSITDIDQSKIIEIRKLLKKLFPHVYKKCEYFEYDNAILLIWRGYNKKLKPYLFMNHHDVVSAGSDWTYPPFEGTITKTRIYGRGTLDTKGGLYCMLKAADELIESGYTPERDIYFESSSTEETSGIGGEYVAKILEKRKIKFDMILDEGGMIVYDPIGGAKGYFAMIGVGEKGCADIKFTVKSNGGHASAPKKNSPLIKLSKFMIEVEKKNNKIFRKEMNPAIENMFLGMSKKMSGPLGFICAHPKFFKPLILTIFPIVSPNANAMFRTTLAFTESKGSDATNAIPEEAWIIGNMRFSHHQGRRNSINKVKKIANKYDINVEILDKGIESRISDYRSNEFKMVTEAVETTFKNVIPLPYIMTGASDSRYYSKLSDNIFKFVPFIIDDQQLESIHGTDENVNISCLAPAIEFYKKLMK